MGRLKEFERAVFEPFSVRFGKIEATNCFYKDGNLIPAQSHINKNFSFFEIVKWEPNIYYARQDEYKLIDEKDEVWVRKDGSSIRLVGSSIFTKREHCIMLANFENLDNDEIDPRLVFCGGRPFELSDEERKIFMDLSQTCYDNIRYQLSRIKED